MTPLPDEKIRLTDHAFYTKAQSDPDFRQALALDTDRALAYYKITSEMDRSIRNILDLLDSVLWEFVDQHGKNKDLKQVLKNKNARRVLLFTPKESGPVFDIPADAADELLHLSALANTAYESLLSNWQS